MKTSWEKVRNFWLAAALASSSLVLLKILVAPAKKPPQPSYSFPATIPLSRWEFVKATPIAVQKLYTPSLATSLDDLTIAGKQYRYLRNGRTLEIETRYFVDTYTDVSDILRELTINGRNIDFNTERLEVGSYAAYQRSNRLYFSACLPSSQKTTVSNGEFRGVQQHPAILAPRFLPWFVGQVPLRDMRCLWTRASLPIDLASPNKTQQELEQAWTEWIQWWQKNYPPEPAMLQK
jgi:cyanosortase A-associated protein